MRGEKTIRVTGDAMEEAWLCVAEHFWIVLIRCVGRLGTNMKTFSVLDSSRKDFSRSDMIGFGFTDLQE